MRTIEAEQILFAAIGAHMRTHNERPYCIRIGPGLASALIARDGTQTIVISEIFLEKGVAAFAEEMFYDYPINVDMDDDFAILTLTKLDWDRSQI